jgi:hypothetical protein
MRRSNRKEPITRVGVVNDRMGVRVTKHDTPATQLARIGGPGRMDERWRDPSKFWHPAANIHPIRIELFCLRHWVEDAEVWLRIAPTTSSPLPPGNVLRKIPVCQPVSVPRLTETPVN